MPLVMRDFGLCEYTDIWQRMVRFTRNRGDHTDDEIWLLQHHAVYTQGTSCRDCPKPDAGPVPVVHSDRGGQMTYHGPGQLVAYLLFDLKRRHSGPKALVNDIQQFLVQFLRGYDLAAYCKSGAPGVYVNGAKIGALGLRISRGYTYHGLSLNVDMDLHPFGWIDPCGFAGMDVTQLADHASIGCFDEVQDQFRLEISHAF